MMSDVGRRLSDVAGSLRDAGAAPPARGERATLSGIMSRFSRPFAVVLTLMTVSIASAEPAVEIIDIEPVWAAHSVGFCLLTHGDQQFVAYYDAKRQMTIAQRRLGETSWIFNKLPRHTQWDSHNYITMAIDSAGHLHVAGDMHCVPLVYFRTSRPLDITTLEPLHRMTGQREQRATYPVFITGPSGELIFRYRDGSSGNGDDLYNVYDVETRTWRRLMDEPLTAGEGKMNAYCTKPLLGPDGLFHVVWVWRDTPDAATNHDLCYARSRDLVHWESAAGKPLKLPITLATADVVDPVPPGGGMINGNTHVGFDSDHRPIVTYHKYDERGRTQIYAARFEGGKWVTRPVSDWDYRWEFGGGGTLIFDVSLGAAKPIGDGRLALRYRYPGKSGTWVLDEATLKPIAGEKPPRGRATPRGLYKLESEFPGMIRHVRGDTGSAPPGVRFVITWETLPSNRDRPRPEPWPAPSMLRLVKITQ